MTFMFRGIHFDSILPSFYVDETSFIFLFNCRSTISLLIQWIFRVAFTSLDGSRDAPTAHVSLFLFVSFFFLFFFGWGENFVDFYFLFSFFFSVFFLGYSTDGPCGFGRHLSRCFVFVFIIDYGNRLPWTWITGFYLVLLGFT